MSLDHRRGNPKGPTSAQREAAWRIAPERRDVASPRSASHGKCGRRRLPWGELPRSPPTGLCTSGWHGACTESFPRHLATNRRPRFIPRQQNTYRCFAILATIGITAIGLQVRRASPYSLPAERRRRSGVYDTSTFRAEQPLSRSSNQGRATEICCELGQASLHPDRLRAYVSRRPDRCGSASARGRCFRKTNRRFP